MTREDIRGRYARRENEVATLIAASRRRGRLFLAGEVACFAAVCAFLAVRTVVSAAWPLWVALAWLVAYVMVRRMDVRNDRMLQEQEDLAQVLRREQQYLAGDFSAFDDGARYAKSDHPFAVDLDIFGPYSLFQRINRTATTGGSDRLAKHLSTLAHDAQRPQAVSELATRHRFLAAFKSKGIRQPIDTQRVSSALSAFAGLHPHAFFASPVALVVAAVLLLCFWGQLAWAIAVSGQYGTAIGFMVFNFLAVHFLCSKVMGALASAIGSAVREVKPFAELIRLVRDEEYMSAYNQHIHGRLRGALDAFEALEQILDALDRRGNLLGNFFMNSLFVADLFTVRRFLFWQRRVEKTYSVWLDAVSEMDALVSMATFARNEPSVRWATVVEQPDVVFEAEGLSHPFLGEKAVKNDFSLKDHHYYIVTGANMAGKSTFLRAVGISIVMAMAGLPVFATSLRLSRFRLFTSMRTSDDLSHGISYFNAELLRLRQLLASVEKAGSEPTLIILDEILKGTNSLDKLNGSRLFLEHIARENVTGIIATHDLELSRMAEQHPDRFHARCFEIELGAHVTYSYKLTEGVARNQNATFLLRQLLDTRS